MGVGADRRYLDSSILVRFICTKLTSEVDRLFKCFKFLVKDPCLGQEINNTLIKSLTEIKIDLKLKVARSPLVFEKTYW